jgi:alkylation response protein AidB-like acyl-CoA dehydrogenase
MYTAPLTEMQFLINDVLLKNNIYAEILPTLLESANKLARDDLEPINQSGDEQGLSITSDGNVNTALGFKDAYEKYVNGSWGSLQFNPEYGGQGLPFIYAISTQEMWNAANMSWGLCPLLTQGAIEAISFGATEDLKRQYLPKLISGEWSATMNLTESDAGSDLGVLKTRACREGDHYLIKGQKIFITWGEHDMTENIVHLVLARLDDAPAGVKGISLFLVPKIIPNDRGELEQRNDCKAISIERKIGIHACPTCVMSYGEKEGAIGYLIGEENKGLACMFAMMNNARLAVGLQGVSLADMAYQMAISYCNNRVQGVAPGYSDAGPIIRHPDVERMVTLMRILTDASRSLCYYACAELDQAKNADTSKDKETHERRVGLLTPLVKGWCTEVAQEVVSLGVQCHGGAGFIEETGIGQLFRDARILPIYEGTNGIQSMDLAFRKVLGDDGLALMDLVQEMGSFDRVELASIISDRQIKAFLGSVEDLMITTEMIIGKSNDKQVIASIAFDFLMMSSIITAAWRMIEGAQCAKKYEIKEKYTQNFLSSRIANTRTYIDVVLPRYKTHCSIVRCQIDN